MLKVNDWELQNQIALVAFLRERSEPEYPGQSDQLDGLMNFLDAIFIAFAEKDQKYLTLERDNG